METPRSGRGSARYSHVQSKRYGERYLPRYGERYLPTESFEDPKAGIGDANAPNNAEEYRRLFCKSSPQLQIQPENWTSTNNQDLRAHPFGKLCGLGDEFDGILQQKLENAEYFREQNGSMVAEMNSEPDIASVADLNDESDWVCVWELDEVQPSFDLLGAGDWEETSLREVQPGEIDLNDVIDCTSQAVGKPDKVPRHTLPIRSFDPLPTILRESKPRRLESIPSLTDDTSESPHSPLARTFDREVLAPSSDPIGPVREMRHSSHTMYNLNMNTRAGPPSEGDSTNSEASEETLILAQDHPLQLVIPGVIRHTLLAYRAWRQRLASGNTRSNGDDARPDAQADGPVGAGTSISNGSKRQRSKPGGDQSQDNNDEEDDDPRPPKRLLKGKEKATDAALPFACPFYRNDPLSNRECFKYRINRFCDLKQHLRRYHSQPRYCGKCKQVATNEREYIQHQEANSCTVIREAPIPPGWTQELQGTIDKATPYGTKDEKKWQTVYKAHFPNDERIHSPWRDDRFIYEEDTFRNFFQSQKAGKTIFRELQKFGLFASFFSEEEKEAVWQQAWLAGTDVLFSAFSNTGLAPVDGHEAPDSRVSEETRETSKGESAAHNSTSLSGDLEQDASAGCVLVGGGFTEQEMARFVREIDARLAPPVADPLPVKVDYKDNESGETLDLDYILDIHDYEN